ncbi:glucose-6-phosphate isomerase [Stappia sp. F7233]|uniref:Glucose-6-phosphate isomerase n=1 Tax=Stappia albiluteola TaxID=2758565 RepID=A0A839AE33_9HYPH|nr:glucose-6-phosphate isomerase [Stappia albiluteola]MBA5777172.1 glucose-6-phosphate isomerase [Stappia albiluteola]
MAGTPEDAKQAALSDAWGLVHGEAKRLEETGIGALFASDGERFDRLSATHEDLLVDFSKERLDEAALDALIRLAGTAGVEDRRAAMLAGQPVNLTEGRAVLHTALRAGPDARVLVDGEDVMPTVRAVLDRFLDFAEDVRSGTYRSASGNAFTDVVNIGIGGSDLGPAMAARALAPDADGPRLHFVSNVDGSHLADTLKRLDPKTTLFIVASKTFTTQETMTNARSARAWLEAALPADAGKHFAAVSTNLAATKAFGIDDARVFGFWDWVGGRYSVWSAIGLPLAIAIGADGFRAFLAGARDMDAHFASAPLRRNLPVLLALIGIWRRNALGLPTVALIPYDQRLDRFAAYVQQLDMESNGKRVTREGVPVTRATGPIIWGEPGTNAQHSFFQLLHQGTDVIPVDFIASASARDGLPGHQSLLLANCLAQARALAFGRSEEEVRKLMRAQGRSPAEIDKLAPHRTFPGNRPSTVILQSELNPFTLGRLIALFEHKVFVQGAIWNVNSYDQWGVELGKEFAGSLGPLVAGEASDTSGLDASTIGLLGYLSSSKD